jgi:tRNA(Ile)-lysidine synthase
MKDHRVTKLESRLLRALARLGLTDRRVLAAVSGGADSLCLVAAMARVGARVEAACIDHGLRPESAEEVRRTEAVCRGLGVPFHSRRVVVEVGPGLEAAARAARYAALEAIRAEGGFEFVATGHTASDQAETVLMRLARGAALRGAGGILERRADLVVRPLLGMTRAETRAYVAALGLEAVEDPMNDDSAFARVRVRREVLPALVSALGPGTERALARFARLAQEDDALLMQLARGALARARLTDGTLDRVALQSFERPVRRRVVAEFLQQAAVPLDGALIEDCLRALEVGACATLPGDRILATRRGAVAIERSPPRTG